MSLLVNRPLNDDMEAIATLTQSTVAPGDKLLVNDISADEQWKTITVAELLAASEAQPFVAAGGTLAVTAELHAGRTIALDTAAGSVCTLPAATGTGNEYEFITTVIATTNSHIIKVANGTDVMTGALLVVDNADGTCTPFGTVAASDTITLNRSTQGSVKIGERIRIKDVKAGYFSVEGVVIATGSEASPFSAGV